MLNDNAEYGSGPRSMNAHHVRDGEEGIPTSWLDRQVMRAEIVMLANELEKPLGWDAMASHILRGDDMPDAMTGPVQDLYEVAKSGDWDAVLSAFAANPELARRCSRFIDPSNGLTFMHEAARFGHERAARVLIVLGAAPGGSMDDREVPAALAARHGHHDLARLLEAAAQTGRGPWKPSPDPDLRPSSSSFGEGTPRRAASDIRVAYGGSIVTIPKGDLHYVDSFERVVIGWHGTYDPPGGM